MTGLYQSEQQAFIPIYIFPDTSAQALSAAALAGIHQVAGTGLAEAERGSVQFGPGRRQPNRRAKSIRRKATSSIKRKAANVTR